MRKKEYNEPNEAIQAMRESYLFNKIFPNVDKEEKTKNARRYCAARDALIQMGYDLGVLGLPKSIGDCNYRDRRDIK